MIVADRKPLEEIIEMIKDASKVLVLGCKGCVTVCNAGGRKEVEILSSLLKIAQKKEGIAVEVDEMTIERQCDPEYIAQVKDTYKNYDVVLSMACSVGPQFLSEAYPDQRFFPTLNTKFMGGAVAHGIWEERCVGCGNCIIHKFDGLCPIARCSKSILHGPCGGSSGGKCEVSSETECIWDSIIQKKMAQGRLEDLKVIQETKDWRTARDGGPRKSIREELLK